MRRSPLLASFPRSRWFAATAAIVMLGLALAAPAIAVDEKPSETDTEEIAVEEAEQLAREQPPATVVEEEPAPSVEPAPGPEEQVRGGQEPAPTEDPDQRVDQTNPVSVGDAPAPLEEEQLLVEGEEQGSETDVDDEEPNVEINRTNYGPGATVRIRGSGWDFGEQVELILTDLDNGVVVATATGVANRAGRFRERMVLPEEYIVDLRLEATGGSGAVAVGFQALVGSY